MDAEYSCIPDYTLETLKAYVEEGRPTGNFLRAVLENNLAEAVGRADRHNYPALRVITKWLFNHAPASCWGTPSKVQGWLKSHLRAKQEGLCLSAEEIRQRLSKRKEPDDTSKRIHICLPSKGGGMTDRNLPDVCRDCPRLELCLGPRFCEYAQIREEMDEAELDAQDRDDAEGKAMASAALDGSFEMAQAKHLAQSLAIVEQVVGLREEVYP